MKNTVLALACCALLASASFADTPPDFIWWEAEAALESTFGPPDQQPFRPYNATEASALSGGKWIGFSSDEEKKAAPQDFDPYAMFDATAPTAKPAARAPPAARYEIEVPADGTYHFYARKFWRHGPFRWRFDQGDWRTAPGSLGLLDDQYIRKFTGANWVGLGPVELTAGRHAFTFEMVQDPAREAGQFVGAYDAFVLTRQPFLPRGKMKPGESYGAQEEGWFAFEPPPDSFGPSPMDLRRLNEPQAGLHGWVRAEGDRFVLGDGQPVRFFAVNASGGQSAMDHASVEHLADWYAKQGINMVRHHGPLYESLDSFASFKRLDAQKLDDLFYFIAALKKRGIYTHLSIYFPLWVSLKKDTGIEGYWNGTLSFGAQYFSPKFQEAYFAWWKQLLTTPNPYTGLTLSEDPAVAIAELVNEDSYFFWTFNSNFNPPEEQMALLAKQFGSWCTRKYGSLNKAFSTWSGGVALKGHPMDDAEAGRAGIIEVVELYNPQKPRSVDTAQFLAESMASFHAEASRILKKDYGFKGLVVGSNWKTAHARILGPLDKYANSVVDVMDRHGYYGGVHEGDSAASYSIPLNSIYGDRSLTRFDNAAADGLDFESPLMDITYQNLPSMISEMGPPSPNRYAAQYPLPAAAYAALQGQDAVHWFCTDGPDWQQKHTKFPIQVPSIAGQFPGAALLYRAGLLQEADDVVEVNVTIADLMALKGSPLSEAANFDQLRTADIPAGGAKLPAEQVEAVDSLAHYVGKVRMNFTTQAVPSRLESLVPYVDRAKRVIKSKTGELVWHYGKGLVAIQSDKAEGAVGFLGQHGAIELPSLRIVSPMHSGAILLAALDGQPLATSTSMLLQVMSEDRNFGWKTEAVGAGRKKIIDLGSPPIMVKNLEGTVELGSPNLRATALDWNGYPTSDIQTGATIQLRPQTLYYHIERVHP